MIYSFLDFKTLGTKVCSLSKKEKNALLYTEILNQLLPLDIPFASKLFENRQYSEIVVQKLTYFIHLSNKITINIYEMDEMYLNHAKILIDKI